MQISILTRHGEDALGLIPYFLSENDPRPAALQFNDHYSHGGGWRPMDGWDAVHQAAGEKDFNSVLTITYPGDPTLYPVAHIQFRDEQIWIYLDAWVAIEGPRPIEISRMD